jgi:hypothetical protein
LRVLYHTSLIAQDADAGEHRAFLAAGKKHQANAAS